jgi:hypothetical protein
MVVMVTKWSGSTPGAVSASSMAAGSMPSACWNAALTWLRSTMALGSRPTMRAARPMAMGWSFASRIGARSGTTRVRSRCSPWPNSGWMASGAQSTNHSSPPSRWRARVPS